MRFIALLLSSLALVGCSDEVDAVINICSEDISRKIPNDGKLFELDLEKMRATAIKKPDGTYHIVSEITSNPGTNDERKQNFICDVEIRADGPYVQRSEFDY